MKNYIFLCFLNDTFGNSGFGVYNTLRSYYNYITIMVNKYMHTAKDNDKDLRPVMRCDAELHCTAVPQLAKTVAEELNLDDEDLSKLLLDKPLQEPPSA